MIKNFNECFRIHEIDLSDNYFHTETLQNLAITLKNSRHTLASLILRSCNITPQGLGYIGDLLESCCVLQKIDLSENNLENENFEKLIFGLRNSIDSLSIIRFNSCHLKFESIIKISDLLVDCRDITEFDLLNKLTEIAVSNGSSIYKIKDKINNTVKNSYSRFSFTSFQSHKKSGVSSPLRKCYYVKEFDLSHNKFDEETLNKCFQYLQNSFHCLSIIRLIGCQLTTANFKLLGELLKDFWKITEFDISNNIIGFEENLILTLRLNNSLYYLSIIRMRSCDLTPMGFYLLGELISMCKRIKELDISYNRMELHSSKQLFLALKASAKSLSVLKFKSCNLIFFSAELIELIKECRVLRELDLTKNCLNLQFIRIILTEWEKIFEFCQISL